MKLLFIIAVAAFLVYSVMAERTGPANIHTLPRRPRESSEEVRTGHTIGGRIVDVKNRNQIEPKRSWTRTSKVTKVSSAPKTLHGMFPGTMVLGDPLKNTGRYPRNRRPDIRGGGKSSLTKFQQGRRSSVDFRSNHPPPLQFSDHPISLEPVFSSDRKLGPSIGPLKFPGIGENVYIRLLVPPDEETSNHVTLHLVNSGAEESFNNIHDHTDFVRFPKPETSFPHGIPKTWATNRPQEVIIHEEPRFVENPVNHLDLTPSNMKAFEFLETRKHPEVPQNMNRFPAQSIDHQPQYLAAPNHHQLPIAFRPIENLINLPNYPPLSTAGESKDEKDRDNGDKVEVPDHSQKGKDTVDDAHQSASFRQTWASPNYANSLNAWESRRVWGLPQPEVTVNRREFPPSEFIEEIRAPDFRPADSFSTPREIRGKSKNATVNQNNPDENGFLNVRMKGDATAATDSTTDRPSRHTTTSETNYALLQVRNSTNPEDLRSTNSNS